MVASAAPVILTFLMVVHSCQAAVQVQVGEIAVPLESVKKLKELLGTEAGGPARARVKSQLTFFTVCASPELPEAFQHVCEREDAPLIFKRLDLAVRDTDLCELCANIACSGC